MEVPDLATLNMSPIPRQASFANTSPVDSVASDSLTPDLSSPTVTEASYSLASPVEPETVQKRKRGRPRKHPVPEVKPKNGRSRTGCITCRKRKKKCDETKPQCMNCKHMNKVCEGFYLPERWRSGQQKAEVRSEPLPKLIPGVEDEADRMLLDHFNLNLSQSLCFLNGKKSPFDTIIVPMALEDLGLMHAILSLSGFQLASGSAQSQIPENVRPSVIERRHHHLDRALALLRKKLHSAPVTDGGQYVADDATIATIAMLCMRTVVAGDCLGEHLVHLTAGYRTLSFDHNSTNVEFREYMAEFFAYHDISCSITSSAHKSPFVNESFQLPSFVPPAAGSYLGVLDGLFGNISKVNNLRIRIRKRRSEGIEPIVDSPSLQAAQDIDAELQGWPTVGDGDTPHLLVRQLYRQCTWIYLYRTIYHRRSNHNLLQGVENGLSLLRRLQGDETVQPVLLMPVFLLGCAAFEEQHRPPVDMALDLLETRRGCGNIKHVRTVVREVWRKMDADDRDSWDWETLMEKMGLNFLIS